jgi:transcriptional regulator GlxA family with amidase domain
LKLTEKDTLFVCSGVEPNDAASDLDIAWLRRLRAFGTKLGGICTGAFALAKAGLIDDRPFTLHWENQPAFLETYPDLIPTENLYETSDAILTCGGGSAATDMMLDLIEADHGRDLAMIVADMCIHQRSSNRRAPQRSPLSVAVGSRNQHLIGAIHIMNTRIEEPVQIEDICAQVGVSRRQLERLFAKYAGVSPSRFYFNLRIGRAHALLSETNMSVTEIAVATGFNTNTHFAAQFRKAYGSSPKIFRKGWATRGD